jgi:hypothetical protein
MSILQINRFSNLHDGKKIIFCKTDYLISEFDNIRKLNNDVILISGNSDYCIDSNLINQLPKNVRKWYAQNALVTNDVVKCLPLGIENSFSSHRGEYHGIGYSHALIKESVINGYSDYKPSKFIYSNFNVMTNPHHRNPIKKISLESNFIDWEEPIYSIENFLQKILDYESVLCPDGNGPDTHRFYETLYMNRIPITFNLTMYNNLHHIYPIICIDDVNNLTDYNFLRDKINEVKTKIWDKKWLSSDFWIKKITEDL